jgi:hypothetical protein
MAGRCGEAEFGVRLCTVGGQGNKYTAPASDDSNAQDATVLSMIWMLIAGPGKSKQMTSLPSTSSNERQVIGCFESTPNPRMAGA